MASTNKKPMPLIEDLLALNLPPRGLRDKLEAMVAEKTYGHARLYCELTRIAPDLYRRDVGIFRNFILCHWRCGAWSPKMDDWLTEVERDKDYDLFRRLYRWKLRAQPETAKGRTTAGKLITFFQSASSQAERRSVIQLFNTFTFYLEETEAMLIYSVEPSFTPEFILKHLKPARGLYVELAQLAQGLDEDFAWALYRKTVTIRKWADEARELCRRATSPHALTLELEKRHPEGLSSAQEKEYMDVLLQLLEMNRALVTPYALLHADLYEQKQVEIFRQKVYPQLWAATVSRDPRPTVELAPMLNSRLPDSAIRLHLEALFQSNHTCDLNKEHYHYRLDLTDALVVQIYKRFPDLVRGKAKRLIFVNPWSKPYEGLMDLVFEANDEELIDCLASRIMFLNRDRERGFGARFIKHYEALRQPNNQKLASRILAVLLEIRHPDYLYQWAPEEKNPLAKYIYDYASKHLPTLFNGQSLYLNQAVRQVGSLKDPAVVENHRQTLLPSLLKPTKKKDRVQSFDLLSKLPNDEPSAHLILDRAREAMALDHPTYPKAALLTLIARLLHRWPNLRHAQENPVVYEAAS